MIKCQGTPHLQGPKVVCFVCVNSLVSSIVGLGKDRMNEADLAIDDKCC